MAIVTAEFNDYTYYCDTETLECSAVVTESKRSQTTFNGLFDEVCVGGNIYTLTSLNYDNYGCFESCTSLLYPPRIPSTVKNMKSCFSGCTHLKFPPLIPSSVTTLEQCFAHCVDLWADYNIGYQICYAIPDSVTNMVWTFSDCQKMLAAPRMPRNTGGVNLSGCFTGCKKLQYAGGFPRIAPFCTNIFGYCPELVYGPELIEVNGINRNTENYTGTTITSGNLVRPTFSTTTGMLNVKSLLTKMMNRGLRGDLLSFHLGDHNTVQVGLIGNIITHLSDLTAGASNNGAKFVKDTSGWGLAVVAETPSTKITFADQYNILRANAWQESAGMNTGYGIEGDFGLWGCIGNMIRSNSSYTTGPCHFSGSLHTGLKVRGTAYFVRADASSTTPDTTYTWMALGLFGGASIDDRAVRWDYSYE